MKLVAVFLLASLIGMVRSQYDDIEESQEEEIDDEPTFTHGQVIRAYCQLVKETKFFKAYDLRNQCALKVRKFGGKVIVMETFQTHFKIRRLKHLLSIGLHGFCVNCDNFTT